MASQLSSEHMSQLVPLLGSLARLLSQHGTIADEQFQVLLDATDLDAHPAALAELQRWARLLARMRGAENPALRQTVVESLLLRGLPEASVLLAVATVVGKGTDATQVTTAPAMPGSARLQASVTNLDFGNLRSGQGATLELEVQGGPGQVIVESDQIQVTPTQFGAGLTRLRVELHPLTSGLLWTTLKLVTARETREVPVTAQWQEGGPPSRIVMPPLIQPPPGDATPPPQQSSRQLQPFIQSPPRRPTALPTWVPAMVEVPAGRFLMGSTDQQIADAISQYGRNENPQHTLTLPTYWIGKTGVTNAQFRPFVEGDGYTNQTYWDAAGWQWRTENKVNQPGCWSDSQWNSANQPVACVTWYEAMAYTHWVSVQTSQRFSLPTEAEWEKAARGTDGRIYPWGNTWEVNLANSNESGIGKTTPVGQYPRGASPYGALDMAGNAWEWTRSIYTPYPYNPTDGREDGSNPAQKGFTLRGGAWSNLPINLRASSRVIRTPDYHDPYVGFRIAQHSQQ